jgi:hypothetical protein
MSKILAALVTLALGPPVLAQPRSLLTVDSGAQQTWLRGLNDRGQAVGLAVEGDSYQPFCCNMKGEITPLSIPIAGATLIFPTAINNRGDIVGIYGDEAGSLHGFLRKSSGTVTTIDYVDEQVVAVDTYLTGINDLGQIVGAYGLTDDPHPGWYTTHGLLRGADGTLETLDHPQGLETTLSMITESGDIAGDYWDGTRVRAFVWYRSGQLQEFVFEADPTSQSALTTGITINDRLQVVGWYSLADARDPWHVDPTLMPHSFFVARDGSALVSDPPGAVASQIAGLNNVGMVAGTYKTEDGRLLGFIGPFPLNQP